MGKALILCDGDNERWDKRYVPRHLIGVYDEILLSRTVRQIRKKMNNYPHVVSHQKCLKPLSTNFVIPSARRWICETILSVRPIWGKDWTMVLLGDVYYTDELIDTIYSDKDKYPFHFYGNSQDIFSFTFTDNASVENALKDVVEEADYNFGLGKLQSLYIRLNGTFQEAGMGYKGDGLNYTYIIDETCDFDTIDDYRKWRKKHG